MYNEKLTITICEGIHLPLEFCDTCPYRNRCPSANTREAREKTERLKKLFNNIDFFVREISNFYNIPKLPISIYDNPHTMYEKLGFFLGQLDHNNEYNGVSNSIFSDPMIILKTTKGVHIQVISEGVLNILLEKLDRQEESD